MTPRWLAQNEDEGGIAFRMGRDGPTLVAEWRGIGTLTVDRGGAMPHFEAEPNASPLLVAKVRQGPVRALLRHLRGAVTLHASAVVHGDLAYAFIGDSGAGKSTLALALATLPSTTCTLVSDDSLWIDSGNAVPTDATLWVDGPPRAAIGLDCGDGTKSPVSVTRVADRPAPLRAIFKLTFGDAIRTRTLQGPAVAGILSRAMIRFVLDEPNVHQADLDHLVELAHDVEVMELERPRGVEHLHRVVRFLERALSERSTDRRSASVVTKGS